MDEKQTGAWLIHHTHKLNHISNELSEYEDIKIAGKAGMLLSAMSATEEQTISIEKARNLANLSSISRLEFKPIINILEKQKLIDIGSTELRILGLSSHSILQHTSEIFNNNQPSSIQLAALALAEEASISPKTENDIIEKLSDEYKISTSNAKYLLNDSKQIGFVDAEVIGNNTLFFNGNLFRRDSISKVSSVLQSLTSEEVTKFTELNDKLDEFGCISFNDMVQIIGDCLCNKIVSVGLIDVSFISNEKGRIGFVTKPSAFNKFVSPMIDDVFDLAKTFISALTYGMRESNYSRGKITQVDALLRKLIEGKEVGPVKAIGNDYRLLEFKGVIKVIPTKNNYNQEVYKMRLLKREVGELALEVLTTGSANEYSLKLSQKDEAITQSTIKRFDAPETNRVLMRKKQIENTPKATNDILLSLRTGNL